MGLSAAQKEQTVLVATKARLEQELKVVRLKLQLVATKILKEEKQKARDQEQAKRAKKEGERPKMKVTKDNVVVGWSRDGKTRYGWGYECWQCQHRAGGGRGGHRHTCGKVPYAR